MSKNMATLFLLASVLAMLLGTGQGDGTEKGKCDDKNQEWSDCASDCRKTCKDVANMGSSSILCSTLCKKGCVCIEGYVLNDARRCVPEKTCGCNPNAKYRCGSVCPLTCDNVNNPPQTCTEQCGYACHCDEGYVRSGVSGGCVRPTECPPPNKG